MSKLGQRLAEVLDAIPQGSGEYAARCPVCGDSKKDPNKRRFLINVEHDKFVCFNGGCPAKGRRKEIIELLEKLDGGLKAEHLIDTPGPKVIRHGEQLKKPDLSPEAQELLRRAVPYSRFPPLIKKLTIKNFLHRKVFTYKELTQLYAVPKMIRNNWDWRVIIPVAENIFQGKSLKGQDPKYLTPPNMDWFINDDIPGYTYSGIDDTIIVGEGILDYHSLPAGDRGLTGGDKRFYNEKMLGYVRQYPDVVYALDSDYAGYMVCVRLFEHRSSLNNLRIFFPHFIDSRQKDLNDLLIHTVQTKNELRSLVIGEAVSVTEAYMRIVGTKVEEISGKRGSKKWILKTFQMN